MVCTIVDLDGTLSADIDKHARARLFEYDAFHIVGVNLDFAHDLGNIGVDQRDVGVGLLSVLTSVHHIKDLAGRLIRTSIGSFPQLNAAHGLIRIRLVDSKLAQISIHYVQLFLVGAVQQRVRRFQIGNGVEKLVGLEIKDQNFGILLGGGEQTISGHV